MSDSMIRFMVIAILGLVVLQVMASPRFKGLLAEKLFARFLRARLPRDTYHIVNNIALRLPDGSTTQIDHIVVSRYGIFVIELKDYRGWIFGDPHAPTWTQSFGKNRKYTFQNPIRQNYRHVKALAELTGIPESLFKPVVAFVGGCTLKTLDKLPPNARYTGNALDYIRTQNIPIIPDEQVPEILDTIRAWHQHSNVSHHEHVRNLRDRKKDIPAKKDKSMKPIVTAMIALGVLLALFLLRPPSENPYRMEMDGLLHENTTLNQTMQEADQELQEAKAQAARLKSDNQRLETEAALLRTRIEELSAQHDALKLQYGLITEREREADVQARYAEAQRAEARRQEELRRQQQIDAVAAANRTTAAQPAYRVFDVIYAGKKNMNGITQNYGRFSMRNYLDQPLQVTATSGIDKNSITVPPNSASYSVWIRAEKGQPLRVTANGHTETHTW
jgi:hypothetical protein